MDDRNGAEHADWLMRGRMAFCRAYPGQIALIIFPPSMIRTPTKKCDTLGPAIALESVRAAYFYTSAFPDIACTFTPPALDKKFPKGTFGAVVKNLTA